MYIHIYKILYVTVYTCGIQYQAKKYIQSKYCNRKSITMSWFFTKKIKTQKIKAVTPKVSRVLLHD